MQFCFNKNQVQYMLLRVIYFVLEFSVQRRLVKYGNLIFIRIFNPAAESIKDCEKKKQFDFCSGARSEEESTVLNMNWT